MIKMLHCKECNIIYFQGTKEECDKCKGSLDLKDYETPINAKLIDIKVPEGY